MSPARKRVSEQVDTHKMTFSVRVQLQQTIL